MSNEAAPSPPSIQTNAGEIPLEDIDKILAEEDPEFAKSLEEVRAVETDTSVVIEASVPEDNALPSDVKLDNKTETGLRKHMARFKGWLFQQRLKFKNRMIAFVKGWVLWLRTRPKEYALYSVVMLKVAVQKAMIPVGLFKDLNPVQKLAALVLVGIVGLSGWILLRNVKGVWLPQISQPILRGFTEDADWVEKYDAKEGGESFYAAFPQERHEFLFGKMKVNLRRTAANSLPMGAFELIVLLDSKDSAIEVRDREVEFNDQLQRVFEDETFNDLETELGKSKLKARLKREMNQKLTQGWVKDINFKTFILKP